MAREKRVGKLQRGQGDQKICGVDRRNDNQRQRMEFPQPVIEECVRGTPEKQAIEGHRKPGSPSCCGEKRNKADESEGKPALVREKARKSKGEKERGDEEESEIKKDAGTRTPSGRRGPPQLLRSHTFCFSSRPGRKWATP